MNRFPPAVAALTLGLGLVLGGCASSPAAKPAPAAALNCVDSTGSLIPPAHDATPCRYPGRSYSQDQLRTTGQTDVGQALQMLDPSITVHH